jgi:hypothetical protein
MMANELQAYQPVRVDAVQCYSYRWTCPACGEINAMRDHTDPDCYCRTCKMQVRVKKIEYENGAITNFA